MFVADFMPRWCTAEADPQQHRLLAEGKDATSFSENKIRGQRLYRTFAREHSGSSGGDTAPSCKTSVQPRWRKHNFKPKTQFVVGAVANIATIAAGMTLGFSAVALPALQTRHGVTEDQASWIASLASIATPLGCLLTGALLEGLGRRRTLMLLNTPALLGWLLIATAPSSQTWLLMQVYAGRLLTGLATGMTSSPATVYVSEVADKAVRGMLVTWTSIGISLGILVVYVLGSIFQENWRLVAGISAGFPLASIVAVWYALPESPVWLTSKGKEQEAELSLRRVRGIPHEEDLPPALEEELMAMASRRSDGAGLREAARLLRRPEAYKPLLVMNAFFFFQQFSGIFVVVFYAVSIVQETGVRFDGYVASVLVGLSRLVVSVVISFASRRYGRRLLCNISGVGMTVSIGVLACFLTLVNDGVLAVGAHSWLPISALVLYILTSTVGFLTLPWAMIGEVFPPQIRGPACGATTCLGYVFSFVVVKLYPAMKRRWGNHGVFTFYTLMALLGTVCMYVYLPETQGRTLDQIEAHFRGGGAAAPKDRLIGLAVREENVSPSREKDEDEATKKMLDENR